MFGEIIWAPKHLLARICATRNGRAHEERRRYRALYNPDAASKKDLVYVTGLFTSTYVDEYEYRERRYQPAFEDLPRKEDYNVETKVKCVANGRSDHKP